MRLISAIVVVDLFLATRAMIGSGRFEGGARIKSRDIVVVQAFIYNTSAFARHVKICEPSHN